MNRRNILFKNISLGILYKALSMGLVFFTIPLLLNYLEEEKYGIWVTVFSVVNVVLYLDGGIGNGLKTKLSSAISLKKVELSKSYITTAYIIVLAISFLVFCVLSSVIFFVDLKSFLNTSLGNSELKTLFFVTLLMICIGFVLNLYKSFFYAIHEASKIEFSMLFYQIIIISTIFLLINFFESNLLYVAITYGVSNILIGLFFTIFFFKKKPELKPSISHFNKDKIKDLLGLSIEFFIIQLSMIVLLFTDNLIISNTLGPEEVASYDVVYKLFTILFTLSAIFQDPFWALYTDAYNKNDLNWIKKTLRKLNLLLLPFCCIVIVLALISDVFIKTWLQRNLELSDRLIWFTALFIIVRVFINIYTQFLNAVGKVNLQMWLYVFGALINIPISYFLVLKLNLGSAGVVLGSLISFISLAIFLPFQTIRILKIT